MNKHEIQATLNSLYSNVGKLLALSCEDPVSDQLDECRAKISKDIAKQGDINLANITLDYTTASLSQIRDITRSGQMTISINGLQKWIREQKTLLRTPSPHALPVSPSYANAPPPATA